MKFTDKMKLHRRAKGWTQFDMAEKMGLQQTIISSWEVGRRVPTPKNIIKIAEALDVDALYLLKEDE